MGKPKPIDIPEEFPDIPKIPEGPKYRDTICSNFIVRGGTSRVGSGPKFLGDEESMQWNKRMSDGRAQEGRKWLDPSEQALKSYIGT